MRLSFSVLWFDDNEDYFDSLDVTELNKEILEWGFEPNIKCVMTPEEFNKCAPFENYDLIVVDRNLEGYPDGQEFIANIRGNAVYTEIIFYTAGNASGLWDAIRENELEGVFVSSRSDILSKIAKVGRQTIRKVLDLENMRGIVMAEVGELDLLLEQIIKIGVDNLHVDYQRQIFTKFHENVMEQNTKTVASLARFIENPETALMLSFCDSDKRWQNFNRLRKCHDKLKGQQKIGDYAEDILRPRNFLAHGKPEINQDGSYLFHYQGKKYYFDDAVSLQLRQTILRYKKEFFTIVKLLTLEA